MVVDRYLNGVGKYLGHFLGDRYGVRSMGVRTLGLQCGNFTILLSLRFYVKSTFGETTTSKTVIFPILGALNFVHLVEFSLQRVQKLIKIKIQNLQIR